MRVLITGGAGFVGSHLAEGRVPDISKIRALIGYQPMVELDEILTRVIASLQIS
jgi:nucleoside-diphosphate-sugar epimerase